MTMTDPSTQARFEDRLLERLQAVVAQSPAPSPSAVGARPAVPRRARRLALSGAGLATAAAVATAVLASGGGTSAAYAVQSTPAGLVTVRINDLRDARGLQAKLRAAGVPAVVDYVAHPPTCTAGAPGGPGAGAAVAGATTGGGPSTTVGGGPERGTSRSSAGGPPPADAGKLTMTTSMAADGSATFTVDPDSIEQGSRVLIASSSGTVDSLAIAVVRAGHDASALPCVPPPPGR